VNGAELLGVDEVKDALRRIVTVIDRKPVLTEVAQTFADRLRAATPVGYSGNLKKSVLWEVEDDEAVVGYSSGVEKDGEPRLDGVLKPRTRGTSVLKWVPPEDLEAILEDTLSAYATEGVLFMESAFAEQINGIS
jgi:hypothetical protein